MSQTKVQLIKDGALSEDSIIHSGDTNTKIRFPAADTVSLETGGSERVRVDSNGKILQGSSTGRNTALMAAQATYQLEGVGSNASNFSIFCNSNGTAAGGIEFGKTRGTSTGGTTVVASGDDLGHISFEGSDGSAQRVAARINVQVDGTPGSSDMPGRIRFLTTPDGSATEVERLLIDSNGFCRQPFKYHLVVQRSGNLTGYDAAGSFGTGLAYNSIASEFKDSALASCFNTSNGLFTAPVDGIYFLEASAYAPGVGFSQGWFTINSSRSAYSDWVQGSSGHIVNCNNMVKLSAGNTVGYHPHAGGGNNNVTVNADANHTWMRITFIG